MYKRLLTIGLVFTALIGLCVAAVPARAQAAPLPLSFADVTTKCANGEAHPKDYEGEADKYTCCPVSAGSNPSGTACFMAKYVNPVINLLAVLVGVVVLGSVIFGGIQYSASAGDPNKAAAARSRIINSLLGLAAFIFLYVFLQWLIPGGFGPERK